MTWVPFWVRADVKSKWNSVKEEYIGKQSDIRYTISHGEISLECNVFEGIFAMKQLPLLA